MTPPIVKVPPVDDEFTIGQELANAAVAAGVEHVVFSGLENVEARTAGTKWAPPLHRQGAGGGAIRASQRVWISSPAEWIPAEPAHSGKCA